jgi:hypothetical protein
MSIESICIPPWRRSDPVVPPERKLAHVLRTDSRNNPDLAGSSRTARNGPRPGVSAGQGPCRLVWQVQDSNLRRHTPTDLQSSAHSALTFCGTVTQTNLDMPWTRLAQGCRYRRKIGAMTDLSVNVIRDEAGMMACYSRRWSHPARQSSVR